MTILAAGDDQHFADHEADATMPVDTNELAQDNMLGDAGIHADADVRVTLDSNMPKTFAEHVDAFRALGGG
eukprot:11388176-Prorocentrum_lima.AAC.1